MIDQQTAFLTGTSSFETIRIVRLLQHAIAQWGPTLSSTSQQAQLAALLPQLNSFDGAVHDTAFQIEMFYMLRKLIRRDIPASDAATLVSLLNPKISNDAAMRMLQAPQRSTDRRKHGFSIRSWHSSLRCKYDGYVSILIRSPS